MTTLWHDLRYGWRKLGRSPGFTVVAVLTIALGIGANSAIFSVVHAVLLEPLPYEDPERLVLVWNRMEATGFPKASIAPPDVADFREKAKSFSGFAATNNVNEATLTGGGEAEQIKLAGVTGNFFRVLGVAPFVGRDFEPQDDAPLPNAQAGPPPPGAVILSHGFWRRRFGGDDVLGESIQVNGQAMTVVGVMAAGFELLMPTDAGMPTDIDAWTPLRLDLASAPRNNQWLRVVGRLAPGASLAEARAEMDRIAEWQRETFQFHRNMDMHVDLYPMHADVVSHVEPALLALFGAVGFVLLIACANVANLLLARTRGRAREMAIRSALGAGGGRLARQILTEGLLLSLLGGAAGFVLARLGVRLLLALGPADLPRAGAIALDGTVMAFTLAATLFAALAFSLAPALASSSARAGEWLKQRGVGGGQPRLRSLLVVVEVALSLVLLIGAGLMLRSFLLLADVRPGFDADGVLTYKVNLPFSADYRAAPQRLAFFQQMEEEVRALPGVEAVGSIFPLPMGGRIWTGPYGLEGTDPETWSRNEANFRVITPGFFSAFGAAVLAGRPVERGDVENRREVAVIDVVMARELWPGEDPIGRRLGVDVFGNQRLLEVVGLVEHLRHEDLTVDGRQTIYFPQHLFPWTQMTVAVRSAGPPASLVAPVRGRIAALDPDVPAYDVRPMTARLGDALATRRFTLILIAAFAAVALLLASVGLFGVLSYSVRQRTAEIGLRMALGAPRETIFRLVVGRGLGLVLCGLGLGLAISLGLTRTLANLLYGISPTDPPTFAALSALLLAVALAACWLPARRASRVDPMVSLRGVD